MATTVTGKVGTSYEANQSQTFHFSASRVPDTRKIKVSWWMTTECNDSAASPTYYLCYQSQKLVVNGDTVVNWTGANPSYTQNGNTVYRGFTDKGSWLDRNYNGKVYHDANGDYVGINRYVQVLGTKWKTGSFELTADNNGDAQFKVSGSFGWNGRTGLNFSKTFTIEGLIPKNEFKVKYNKNADRFVSGNTIINMPTTQTKEYGKSLTLSSKVPVTKDANGISNYTFKRWETKMVDSFTGGQSAVYDPGDKYTKNEAVTLLANWDKNSKSIKFDLSGGEWQITNYPTSALYSEHTFLPIISSVKRYGYKLSGWKDTTGIIYKAYDSQSTNVRVQILRDETFTAVYSGNSVTVVLHDIDRNVLRTISTTFGAVLTGDFTYEVAGYKCLGWTTTSGVVKRNPDDEPLPVVPNKLPKQDTIYGSPNIYIGCGKYTRSNPFIIPNTVGRDSERKQMVDGTLHLYPVLEYSTSIYIYTSSGWKLAMPYVYTSSGWKQCLGYTQSGNSWKK